MVFFYELNGVEKTFSSVEISPNDSPVFLVFLSSDQTRSISHNQILKVSLAPESTPLRHVVFINTMQQIFRVGIRDGQSGDFVTINPGVNPPIPLPQNRVIRLALEVTNFGWQSVYGTNISQGTDSTVFIILYPPMFPGGLDLRGAVIYLKENLPGKYD